MTTVEEITNAAIYALLEAQGKTLQGHGQTIQELTKELRTTNTCVTRMNGRVAHVENRTKAHTQDLGDLWAKVGDLRERVSGINARTQTEDAHQGERLREVKQEQAWTRERLWGTAKQVGGTVAVIALLVKSFWPG